jgi:multidrug resistance efflux pump
MLEAARAQRSELRNQLDNAEDRRENLQEQLSQLPSSDAVGRAGLEARITDTDARIKALDQQIAQADANVAAAAAIPGATIEPPRTVVVRRGPPEEAWFLGGMFIVFVMLPLAIAQARRIWRRPAAISHEMPAELTDRLNRLEQAVDAVAVELERVGEGQRYVTRVLTEQPGQRALGAGAAEPLEVRQREAIQQSRP